ncbi:MAG: hypothetical protein E7256_09665 [Lachnospiraceae bacterium]|nr:hypothetical protein [Lachnospiraceae bacterium]
MSKKKTTAFALATFSTTAKMWLLIFIVINFLCGFLFLRSLALPYVLAALVNIYAVVNLFKLKKLGFSLLLSSLAFNLFYTSIAHKSPLFLIICVICLAVTLILLRAYSARFHT